MRVSVIVLAWGVEPYLQACVSSVLASHGVELELVVVDNGSPAVAGLPPSSRVRIVTAPRNLGFAGGVNLGVAHATGECLVLLNSDAIIRSDSIERLVDGLTDFDVVSGGIRIADRPQLMNSAGNPVHFMGLVWAGGHETPASLFPDRRAVASASGAFLAVRRTDWDALGGFPADYFAYHEDTELSLRAWLTGRRVGFVPDAIAAHHYEFSRNPAKMYLLQRNRWLTVLTTFPTKVLWAALPMMVLFEFALAGLSLAQGWFRGWLRAWLSLFGQLGRIRSRRRECQAQAVVPDAMFAGLLTTAIDPAMIPLPAGTSLVNRIFAAYWRVALRLTGV
ncbi:glycosyltransferase family 2 protein [Jatrophihabitans telluris]|uniref:Glycosyltransferase family 2 protein n=1 Tax=Jatrophihabitans telluris TaxID=2038343 RepID=A0ABY4R088_9ACTN|nr:glycosyltransferase family 2 protein [Jatrophihabitans telluris]UQX88686.1 glycosyltransferase family 2 protein [Jatrophihabitans telluris]